MPSHTPSSPMETDRLMLALHMEIILQDLLSAQSRKMVMELQESSKFLIGLTTSQWPMDQELIQPSKEVWLHCIHSISTPWWMANQSIMGNNNQMKEFVVETVPWEWQVVKSCRLRKKVSRLDLILENTSTSTWTHAQEWMPMFLTTRWKKAMKPLWKELARDIILLAQARWPVLRIDSQYPNI